MSYQHDDKKSGDLIKADDWNAMSMEVGRLGSEQITNKKAFNAQLEQERKTAEAEIKDTKTYIDQRLPSGVIVMWSGEINAIPDGWNLCDGYNNTPDLRDRFIVGAGYSYDMKTTGGEKEITLSVDQMPNHSHQVNITNGGEHSHYLEKSLEMWHRSFKGSDGNGRPLVDSGGSNHYMNQTDDAGTHSHNASCTNAGNNVAHENRPPYLALAYIMKN